jgi:multiple sugar transport system permease protein
MRRTSPGQLLLSAGRLVLVALYALPIVYLVASSLKSDVDLAAHPSALLFAPDFAAYEHTWNGQLIAALVSSVEIALGTTILVLLLAAPAAYALARHRHVAASIAVGTLIVLQMVPQATTVIPLFKILATWHLLGSIVAVILSDSALLMPFAIILLRPFFLSVPREVEEAAQVDGATGLRSFVSVSLPLARNGLITVGILVFMITWGEFIYAITILTDPGMYPLTALLSQQVTHYGIVWNRLFALAVACSIPLVVLFLVTRRRLTEGLSLGVGK